MNERISTLITLKQPTDTGTSGLARMPLQELLEIKQRFDFFFCCASFESRSVAIPLHIDADSIGQAFIFHNPVLNHFNGEHLSQIAGAFDKNGRVVAINPDTPFETERIVYDIIQSKASNSVAQARSYLIDITTFTRETLLIVLNAARREMREGDSVTLVYNPADEYFEDRGLSSDGNDQEGFEESSVEGDSAVRWFTRGVREIRSVIGFPGEILPSRPLHLIVLTGYEYARADLLIEQFEPRYLSLGCSTEEGSFRPSFYRQHREFKDKISALYGGVKEFDFWPNDPLRTFKVLERLLPAYPECNVVVSPINTKISCLGAALLSWHHPEVQICYAQGDLYNYDNYSTPAGHAYFYDISDYILLSKADGASQIQ
jgi:hypothetical protein